MRKLLLSLSLLISVGSYAQQKQSFKKYFGKGTSKQTTRNKAQIEHLPQTTAYFIWQNDSWNIHDTISTYYNAKGLVDSALTTMLNGEQTQINYTYDAEGRQIGYTMLQRDDMFFPWDSVTKSFSTYDQHGGLTSEIEYLFNPGSGWKVQWGSKSTFTYNTSNFPLTEEMESYDEMANGYIKEAKAFFDYDSTGKLVTVTSKKWDNVAGTYKDDYKTADVIWYKWNGVNYLTSLVASGNEYEWNGTAYVLSTHFSYKYDSYDNKIEELNETLVGATWMLDYGTQYELTYDQDGALTEEIEASWDNVDSAWVNNQRYAYSNFVQYNGINDLARQDIGLTIAPNPFNEKAEISITSPLHNPELVVYDITGKQLQSHRFVSNKCVVEKGDLATGMYFYVVTDNQQTVASGKIIIK